MICKVADNIVSPLGFTTQENYLAVKSGYTSIQRYSQKWALPFPFMASLFSEVQENDFRKADFTRFEGLALASISRALAQTQLDLTKEKVLFILSSTKGNVGCLKDISSGKEEESTWENDYLEKDLSTSAKKIADYFGILSQPIVVCNACISGLSAIILSRRLLLSRAFDYAIVCGVDEQSDFIVSGFHSFMALSPEVCKPFDIERRGLNLGEAAATLILKYADEGEDNAWSLGKGRIFNDAYHISAPAKKGDGALLALQEVTEGIDKEGIAFINCHGTATMFNDQMEAKAIERADLQNLPVNAYKGYFGHTLAAAGVLEAILSMYSLDDKTILGTKGFEELGVSGGLHVVAHNEESHKNSFIKMLSGFGGCNAAMVFSKHQYGNEKQKPVKGTLISTHKVTITATEVSVDGKLLATIQQGKKLLDELYKQYVTDYPKYYKMDGLSQLGFIASELVLQAEGKERFIDTTNRGILLFNRASSVRSDMAYYSAIYDRFAFYPSPSTFIYTLPNIVMGEIAIRNRYYGETSFYILPAPNAEFQQTILQATFRDSSLKSILSGWINYIDDYHFETHLSIFEYKE